MLILVDKLNLVIAIYFDKQHILMIYEFWKARRALRALKALVKLQALVRGHIVRKKTADMLRRMQTLVRLQTKARASRAHLSSDNLHSFKSSLSHYPVSSKIYFYVLSPQ